MKDQKLIKSAGKVGLAVMASRVLGLVRDQIFTSCFGVGLINDAFFMAFRIPNLLRDLFAEGALSSAFVTVFARKRKEEGDEGAWHLARLVMTLQTLILTFLVTIGLAFTPEIVHLMAPSFALETGKVELTILLTRILFPFIIFVGMAALSMGVLNTYGRFGLPASASTFFNLGSLVVGLSLVWIFDPAFGKTGIICMAIGTISGGVLQWLVQVPALRKLGYRYRPQFQFNNPSLLEIIKLIGPAVIGVSAAQINVIINSVFASAFSGGVTCLAIAFRLIQLPIGLFGVSISTATLPSLAVDATHLDKENFRKRIENALRLNAALCIPAACGLALLGVPLIGLIFQRGKFEISDTMTTARILMAYSLGLIGYASSKILAPAFYALDRVVTPMCVSLGTIGATYLLNWYFVHETNFGPAGLALTTSITALSGAGILLSILSRLVGGMSPETWRAMLKILLASGIMSIGLLTSENYLGHLPNGDVFPGYLLRVCVGVPLGVFLYTVAAKIFKLEEIETAILIVKNKFSSKSEKKL